MISLIANFLFTNTYSNAQWNFDERIIFFYFEVRQWISVYLQLKKQITDVEESNLAEKPWHLRGEVTAADRPENSLLTTHLDYKFTSARELTFSCVG